MTRLRLVKMPHISPNNSQIVMDFGAVRIQVEGLFYRGQRVLNQPFGSRETRSPGYDFRIRIVVDFDPKRPLMKTVDGSRYLALIGQNNAQIVEGNHMIGANAQQMAYSALPAPKTHFNVPDFSGHCPD